MVLSILVWEAKKVMEKGLVDKKRLNGRTPLPPDVITPAEIKGVKTIKFVGNKVRSLDTPRTDCY